jgi:flavodoxin
MTASHLIVYFSMTGRTRPIANEIRRVTGGDIEEIREPDRREGLPGIWRGLLDAMLRRCPPILVPNKNPAQYDVVIVGGPIWAGRMASPVRTYAKRYLRQAPEVAFFCTAGGRKADAAFEDLQRLCELQPRATWLVDARHLEPEAHRAELAHFIAQIRRTVRADEARLIAEGVDRLA